MMKTDYERIVRCIERALDESDGFDVALPYEAVTKLLESSQKFHRDCELHLQAKQAELKELEDALRERTESLERAINNKMHEMMSQALDKINAAGEAAFMQTQQMLQHYSECGEIKQVVNKETDYEHLDLPVRELNVSTSTSPKIDPAELYKHLKE